MTEEDRLRRVQEAVDVAQEALDEAVMARRQAIWEARVKGVPVDEIAAVLGVHRQIVYRILRRP